MKTKNNLLFVQMLSYGWLQMRNLNKAFLEHTCNRATLRLIEGKGEFNWW